jgi:hypothetical protein
MRPNDEDPIVSEVRAARDKLVEQAGGDIDRLIAMLEEMEKCETRPVVSFPPRKPSERAAG